MAYESLPPLPPWGSGTRSGAFGAGSGALRAPKYLILARVNALGIPFSVPTIGISRLQQAGNVYNGQVVSTWGRQCLQTIHRLAPMHG